MAEPRGSETKFHSVPAVGFKEFIPGNNSLSCAFVLCGSLIYFTFKKVKTMPIARTASWCRTRPHSLPL